MASERGNHSYAARKALDAEISRMAALVETQLQNAILAFERRDIPSAEKIIAADERIDEFDRDIETRAVELLAEATMPLDVVREVATFMKISGELERIGDLAKNVAKRTIVISREQLAPPVLGVARMGRASLRQLSDVLDAYNERNLEAANAVWRGDDELDALYNSVFQEILMAMMGDPKLINSCTHLVFMAKNFERVGDHATNLAETLHFQQTGSPIMEPRPKSDDTSSIVVSQPAASENKQVLS